MQLGRSRLSNGERRRRLTAGVCTAARWAITLPVARGETEWFFWELCCGRNNFVPFLGTFLGTFPSFP